MQNRPDPSPAALRAELERLADPAYRAFSSGLLPGVDNLLGVRLPALRRLAGALAKATGAPIWMPPGTTALRKPFCKALSSASRRRNRRKSSPAPRPLCRRSPTGRSATASAAA